MKKIFTNVMLVAAAAMTFFGCQKPEVIAPEVSEEVMLVFGSEKPAFDDVTKTEWNADENTIHWSKGDKISVAYAVNGVWQNASGNASGNAKIYQSNPLNESATVANFTVPTYFAGSTEGTHVFYSVYPALGDNNFPNAPVAAISVPANQNPKANSFDSSADVMVGMSNEYGARPAAEEAIPLLWTRLVAHAVVTLKDINGLTENEKVEFITLTAQDGANLVGLQNVDLTTQEVVKNNSEANFVKVSADDLNVVGGNVTFWVCVLPETLTSLTVVVETDKATYTREIATCSLEFKQNARNTLAVKMDEAVRVEKTVAEDEFVDVLNRALTGSFETSYASWTGKTSVSAAVYAGQSAGGNESIQLRSNNSNSGIVTTTSGGNVKKVVVKWNSNTASGRTLNVYGSNTAYTNPTELYDDATSGVKVGTIVCGTSTELVIDGDYKYLGLRSASGAMYIEEIKVTWSAGSEDAPEDTPEEPDTTPSVELEVAELELTAEKAEGTVAVEAINITSIEVRALVAEDAQEESDWLVAEYDESNACITYSAAANESEEVRTAYIEVYALDAQENEVVAGVKVTQAGKEAEPAEPQALTVAEFLAAEVDETVFYTLKGTITNVANTTYGNFDLTDETGTVYVYGLYSPDGSANKYWATSGAKLGDDIVISVTRGEYSNSPQGANARFVELVTPGTIAFYTIDTEAVEFASEGGEKVVNVSVYNTDATVTASSDNAQFVVAVDGNKVTISSEANELEEKVEGTVTVQVGELAAKTVKVALAAKPASGEVEGGQDDFHTISSTNTSYVSGKTTAGWNYANCAIFKGGTSDSSPSFKMIGDASNRALCMNGKTSAVGSITSPTLTTGCGTLKFNYGLPFSDTKIKFRVDVKQNGSVVKTFTVEKSSATKFTKYSHEETINVAGDFQIVFTNLSPSSSTSNKDRTAVWDVEWTGCKN